MRDMQQWEVLVDDQVQRNRAAQAELYGEPLGELFRRIADGLGLTQARLADAVGLSAPMLSQLMSARRVKIGNPVVVQRIHALTELAAEVAADGLDPGQVAQRVAEIRAATGAFARGAPTVARAGDPRVVVHGIQNVLRAVASAPELLEAAERLQDAYPEIAEVLRVYGAGRTDEAVAHYERVEHLA